MKCYRKNGSDDEALVGVKRVGVPSMKCYRKNGSDVIELIPASAHWRPQ